VELLERGPLATPLVLTVDGGYEYTDEDLQNWDSDGPGSTFRKYYAAYYDLVVRHGLDPGRKPEKLDISETRQRLGYKPQYSLKNLLDELDRFGEAGPPAPAF
jgi:hypothetical protein